MCSHPGRQLTSIPTLLLYPKQQRAVCQTRNSHETPVSPADTVCMSHYVHDRLSVAYGWSFMFCTAICFACRFGIQLSPKLPSTWSPAKPSHSINHLEYTISRVGRSPPIFTAAPMAVTLTRAVIASAEWWRQKKANQWRRLHANNASGASRMETNGY